MTDQMDKAGGSAVLPEEAEMAPPPPPEAAPTVPIIPLETGTVPATVPLPALEMKPLASAAVAKPEAAPSSEAPTAPVKPEAPAKPPPPERKPAVLPPEQVKPPEIPTEKPAAVPPKKLPTPAPPAPPEPTTAAALPAEKSTTRKEIESILQTDLGNLYAGMTPDEQKAFSQTANETASKLEQLISTLKARAGDVLKLIKDWLSKIPKVNKYFLEQASKIKTDQMMELQRRKKKESRLLH